MTMAVVISGPSSPSSSSLHAAWSRSPRSAVAARGRCRHEHVVPPGPLGEHLIGLGSAAPRGRRADGGECNRDKDAEILALRHQLSVLQRQLGPGRVRFTPADRALLAALLHRLPRKAFNRLHLMVRPDTVLRWHRDLIARRHARRSRPRRPGRPRTLRSVRVLVLRLVRENPGWSYRRVHGEPPSAEVLEPFTPAGRSHAPAPIANVRILRRDRLGGLIRGLSGGVAGP